MHSTSQYVCVGPTGSGKTSLLAILGDADSPNFPRPKPVTIPTIGTSWVTIGQQIVQGVTGKMTNSKIIIRELGGAMAPIWSSYLSECQNGLLFVIDASNSQQIAAAAVLLLRTLCDEHLLTRRCLLILNKLDCSKMSLQEIVFMLRVADMEKHSGCQIRTVRTSVVSGEGIDKVKQWIALNSQEKKM